MNGGGGDDAALASVRAFLDAYDAGALGMNEADEGMALYAAASGSDGDAEAPQAPRSKRVWTASRRGYSTKLQRRKRAEMNMLREYACELEERVAKLQHKAVTSFQPCDGTMGVKSVALARQEAVAAGELRLRRRSEATNRQLRAELERCQELRVSITRLIDKHQRQSSAVELRELSPSPFDSMSPFATKVVPASGDTERRLEAMILTDGVFAAASSRSTAPYLLKLERCQDLQTMMARLMDKHRRQSAVDALKERSPSLPSMVKTSPFASQVVIAPSDIERRLELMILQTDSVFAWSPSRSIAPCWIETNRLNGGAEIRSSTTSGCSVATAESLLWITTGFSSGKEVWCSNMVSADGNSFAKAFVMPLLCRPWTTPIDQQDSRVTVEVPVKVHHFARKVRDDATGRLTIVMLAAIELPGASSDGKPQLMHELSWTLVTPIASGSGNAGSTAQTCYRIGGDDQPEGPGREDDEERAMRTSVMRALVFMTRRHRSLMQNWLLDAADEW